MIKRIKKAGMKAGMSIKPNTPASVLFDFLEDLDLVLIMSVEPGKGGQSFIETSTKKILKIAKEREHINNKNLLIGSIPYKDEKVNEKVKLNVIYRYTYLYNI